MSTSQIIHSFKSRSKSRLSVPSVLEDLCISIPLKGGQGKEIPITESFVKVIEHEYAVRYLEHMGINPTEKMICRLLKAQGLSSCEITSGWNTLRLEPGVIPGGSLTWCTCTRIKPRSTRSKTISGTKSERKTKIREGYRSRA